MPLPVTRLTKGKAAELNRHKETKGKINPLREIGVRSQNSLIAAAHTHAHTTMVIVKQLCGVIRLLGNFAATKAPSLARSSAELLSDS